MTHKTPRSGFAFLLGVLFASSVSAATTIAHWTDFSTTTVEDVANDYDLTRQGATADWYSTADNDAFTPASKSLSLEVVFLAESFGSGGSFLAGHFNGSTNQRSYTLAVTSGKLLQVVLSSNGTNTGASNYATLVTGFSIATDVQYYVGATVDLSSAIQAERTVTVYLQNLTTPESPLQTQTFSGIALTGLHNPQTAFTVGAMGAGGNQEYIKAVFDEVRLSDGVLGSNELLVAIPEPSSVGLLLGGFTFGVVALRRRRR